MFIKYDYTADGKPIMVEVTEEVAEFLREDKRLTENAERKERCHCPYSIDALEYEGRAYYYRDTPEQIVLRNERNRVLLDLSSGEPFLTPHSPDVYSTIQIPCRWTGEATPTPVFDMYMHTLTGGDEAVTKLLLEFMGACLSNVRGYRMKKSLFLVGPGNSGKSQLKALCERLLGRDNFTGIDLKEIEARFGTSSIYGMRLAGSSDMRYMTVSELNAFKLLTGGDCVFAEFKGEQQFKYTYCGLLWFCMNKLPHFGGDTGAWVYDRIMIVHCDNVIENSRQDKMLLEKMYAEREGIVYKCIAALMDVIRNGYRYSEPKCVLDARNTYMEDNSTVITFFHECMVPRKHKDNCTTGKLYDVYRAWCVDNNNGYAETARAFRDKLCEYLGKDYKELTVHTEIGTCYRDPSLTTLSPWEKFCLTLMELEQRAAWEMVHIDG